MNLRTRRILYSFFIALFFFAAPPLVLYTTGFRYDFRYNRIVETGSAVIKSEPEDVAIFFNGERRKERTPTIINNILPGKITLLLKKEGYHDWEKTIAIAPRVSVIEDGVTLFLNETPAPIIDILVSDYWWNKERNRLAYITAQKQLRIRNMLNNDDILVANIGADTIRDAAWSEREDIFLFGRGNGAQFAYYLIDARANDKSIVIATPTQKTFNQVLFDPTNIDRVYALYGTALIRLSYITGETYTYTLPPIARFTAHKETLALMHRTPEGMYYLSWFSANAPTNIIAFPHIPLGKNAHPAFIGDSRVGAYDNLAETLTLYPAHADEEAHTIQHVSEFTVTKDAHTIIYTDGYGLFAYSVVEPKDATTFTPKQKLIIRYSQPISHFALSDDERYIFYVLGDTVRVVERDDAVIPRTLILLSNEHMARFTYAKTSQDERIDFVSTDNELLSLPLTRKEDRSFFFGG